MAADRAEFPFVVLKSAVSLDGRLDHAGPSRLVLSSSSDLDWADAERASADAVLVGAGTLRRDDPSLLVKSPWRIAARIADNRSAQPTRVILGGGGGLPTVARVWSDAAPTIVVGPSAPPTPPHWWAPPDLPASLPWLLGRLSEAGFRRLLVEAGGKIGKAFLESDLVDELQLSFAPFLIGDASTPTFAPPGIYPQSPGRPLFLASIENLGGAVAATFRRVAGRPPESPDHRWLRMAVELSRRCPPSDTAFAVGAVLVAADGRVTATGFSRETGPTVHAEEVALAKAAESRTSVAGGTLYSSLEPCGERKSGATPCVDRIVAVGIRRVVFGAFEPDRFVHPCGARRLGAAGVELSFLPLAPASGGRQSPES